MRDVNIALAPWASNIGHGVTTDAQRKARMMVIVYSERSKFRCPAVHMWPYPEQFLYDQFQDQAELTAVLLGDVRER